MGKIITLNQSMLDTGYWTGSSTDSSRNPLNKYELRELSLSS